MLRGIGEIMSNLVKSTYEKLTPEITKRNIMREHGVPGVREENGFKIRVENLYLTAFEKFDKAFNKYLKLTEIDAEDYPFELTEMYKFFQELEYKDTKKITRRLNHLLNSEEASVLRQKMLDFFADIDKIAHRSHYTVYKIKELFAYHFGVQYFKKRIPNKIAHGF